MPYLGNEPGAITDAFTDTFTGDGSETAFTLTQASTTNSVFVRIHGVMQRNGTDFNVDGTTLTFTTAPPNASNNIVVQFFTIGSVQAVADNAVVTAKINDNAVTLAKLAGGTDGNIISFDASGDPVAVATGNDGQVLTSAGAGAPPVFEDAGGGGSFTFISSVTASNSASVAFTGLDATYDRYWITFASIVPQTDNTQIYAVLGTGAGPTYNTGSNYVWEATGYSEQASSWSFGFANGDTKINIGYSFSIGTATGEHCHGDLYLVDPANTSNYTSVFTRSWGPQQSNSSLTYDQIIGMLEVQTAVTAIKFTMSSGNIASGTFRLYGLNKS